MKKTLICICAFGLIFSRPLSAQNYGDPVKQIPVKRIELMPDVPEPYKMLDWKKKALDLMPMCSVRKPVLREVRLFGLTTLIAMSRRELWVVYGSG